jgi:hypothetical protein
MWQAFRAGLCGIWLIRAPICGQCAGCNHRTDDKPPHRCAAQVKSGSVWADLLRVDDL